MQLSCQQTSMCGQVTALGGLEAVITAKKWTEVSQPFQFPPSFTSKSFTLRKMYSRLLHDYEQVYFHHNTGPPTLPPGVPALPLPNCHDWQLGTDRCSKLPSADCLTATEALSSTWS